MSPKKFVYIYYMTCNLKSIHIFWDLLYLTVFKLSCNESDSLNSNIVLWFQWHRQNNPQVGNSDSVPYQKCYESLRAHYKGGRANPIRSVKISRKSCFHFDLHSQHPFHMDWIMIMSRHLKKFFFLIAKNLMNMHN